MGSMAAVATFPYPAMSLISNICFFTFAKLTQRKENTKLFLSFPLLSPPFSLLFLKNVRFF